MRTHETDLELSESRQSSTRRHQDSEADTSHALTEKRTDVLNAAALLHLQKTAGNASVSSLLSEEGEGQSPVREVVESGEGRPLDPSTRTLMESRFGYDFGDVRVHTDAKAAESAKSVNAQAYTVGTDVVFQDYKYTPETDSGKRMLAHELTHVIQQKSGPVSGTRAPGGINISHPSDSFEQAAERTADRVMSLEKPTPKSDLAHTFSQSVQRERALEEELVPGSVIQRQESSEEEEEEPVEGPV